MKNLQPIYYHYLSGVCCGFWQTQEAATVAAEKAEKESPDPHLAWTTGCFKPGSLELQSPESTIAGYLVGNYWESIVDIKDIPWVQWGNLATQRPSR